MDDRLLVAQAKEGNREAFGRLVELYQTKVYHLAFRMTGSAEDASDLTQDAFLKAWRGLSTFQGDSSFATWLYSLTNHVCIDFLRREKRRREMSSVIQSEDEEHDLLSLIPDSTPSPHTLLEHKELKQSILQGLEQLSMEHRQVLLLREIVGLSYSEISEVTGLEVGTVKSRIARARLSLRKIILSDGNFLGSPSSK